MRRSSRTKFSQLAIDCFLSRFHSRLKEHRLLNCGLLGAGGSREQVPGFGPSTRSRWVFRRNMLSGIMLLRECGCNYQVFAVVNAGFSSRSAMRTPRMSFGVAEKYVAF